MHPGLQEFVGAPRPSQVANFCACNHVCMRVRVYFRFCCHSNARLSLRQSSLGSQLQLRSGDILRKFLRHCLVVCVSSAPQPTVGSGTAYQRSFAASKCFHMLFKRFANYAKFHSFPTSCILPQNDLIVVGFFKFQKRTK